MISATTATLWYQQLLSNLIIGREHLPDANTTLNQYLGSGIENKVGAPKLNLLTIGNYPNDELEYSYRDTNHAATDACLLRHTPFAIRREDDDLTSEERINYRLRTIKTYSGVRYAFYYGRTIGNEVMRNNLVTIKKDNTQYKLSPIRTDKIETYRNENAFTDPDDTGEYISTVTNIKMLLTVEDMINIKNAITLQAELENRHPYYTITELGLVTSILSEEADSAQLAIIANTEIDSTLEEGIDERITLGGMTFNNLIKDQ